MEVYGAYGDGVARIREAVLENQLQMRQVELSLLSFQKGLLGVEREMLPVYKLTEQLRGTQKNIDLSVQELRQINENFVAAHKLAPVLLNGSKFDQDEYVKALQKLLVAITFLEGHRSYEGSVKALDQAKELLVQTVLLREYGKQRFGVIRLFIGGDSAGNSMGFDLNSSVTALAKCLIDIQITIEAEKALAGLVFANEELANGAFRYSAHQILESWKKDIDLSLRSPKLLDAVKLLLIHDSLLTRVEALEAAVAPPLLLRDREGKGLEDPWVLSKVLLETELLPEMATCTRYPVTL
ncbi:Hypothetical protein PHPALM_4931 [Phytophthora palmivora]|uniref:Uncharacterized protein n=1 Tax=Phytophthora palmivora TaxID=4796 RepID=A0A2P4YIM2_9STRA|nr:Hypothetical protein PHPALM_4931 [Phytophthora palmivora]